MNSQNGCREEILWNGKADGASGDGVSFAIVGDHENSTTDMTNLVITEVSSNEDLH